MRRVLALISIFGLLAVAGCNTAEGFGRDVESAGQAIEEEAEE
ncbi:entericidin A/B family lipoprotein [Ferruginivarius sediminum]|uniref:Entericidin, EcnA/B family n=1 Tax=Ferruginivarius sediminum TaxID=2661937 RepID=A0A369T4X7_9PROT|nr:entericidin A/B family lipoprotein [Ferruginivarius sediminum]RDD60298.1 entericidin, EcnA/B family [Ferruginivarius sediminum]